MEEFVDLSALKLEDGEAKKSKVVVEARLKTGWTKEDALEHKKEVIRTVEAVGRVPNWTSVPIASELQAVVDYVLVGSRFASANECVEVNSASEVLFYSARESEALAQEIAADGDQEEAVVASLQWELPNRQFDPLFENLFYEDDIKTELLSFVQSVINLSRLGVDTNVIDLNRLILLHGPPGTGKTTFCKALAQRLAVRLQDTYRKTIFVEINSHSLFSKWFSESGKLVAKLFDQIGDLASEKKWLVVVLVDEVESLVMGRGVSSAEPTDAVRAVNAVLTQIDKIRSYSNVLVMTTSNITGALDSAFLDRTDVARFVGNPSAKAAGRILLRVLAEFARLGILSDFDEEKAAEQLGALVPADSKVSGRLLKKAPVLAYARLNKSNIKMEEFVAALRHVLDEAAERRP